MEQVATLAAELIDDIEVELNEEYEGIVEIGTIALIVELNETLPDGGERTGIHYRCSDPRRWVQAGLFNAAARTAID